MSDRWIFAAIFGGVWALIGIVFLAIGLAMRRAWTRREERLRARTDGVVLEMVRHESHSSSGSSVSWRPLVEFDYEGRRISLEAADSVSRKKYYEGQRVTVLYDPDDPAAFRVAGEEEARTLFRVFTAVGAGCLAVALIAVAIVTLTSPRVQWLARYRWLRR